ncbi:MAG: LptF/LptG family permease [Devosiaceae bacterium]|nr:LptF/LptG family permease [Devosiaceae bacterium]
MSHLSRYLVIRFAGGAFALYFLATFLVWLTQMLRLFDLVTEKGQSIFVLMGQSFLTTPPLSRQIIYICMGIGLARALAAMQSSKELHTIHISRRTKSIWSALAIYSAAGAILALFIANWAEPASRRSANEWSAQIAVDLLSKSLTPGRFTDISNGVVVRIESRAANGIINGFFADDQRGDNIRRTYRAERAEIVAGNDGFEISMKDGSLQVMGKDGEFSEVNFARYDLAVDALFEPVVRTNPLIQRDTMNLIAQAQLDQGFSAPALAQIHLRMAEGLRVISLVFLVGVFGAFPHGKRRNKFLPPDLVVLVIAFSERSLSNFAATGNSLGFYLGPVIMLTFAVIIFVWRMTPRTLSKSTPSLPPQQVLS